MEDPLGCTLQESEDLLSWRIYSLPFHSNLQEALLTSSCADSHILGAQYPLEHTAFTFGIDLQSTQRQVEQECLTSMSVPLTLRRDSWEHMTPVKPTHRQDRETDMIAYTQDLELNSSNSHNSFSLFTTPPFPFYNLQLTGQCSQQCSMLSHTWLDSNAKLTLQNVFGFLIWLQLEFQKQALMDSEQGEFPPPPPPEPQFVVSAMSTSREQLAHFTMFSISMVKQTRNTRSTRATSETIA